MLPALDRRIVQRLPLRSPPTAPRLLIPLERMPPRRGRRVGTALVVLLVGVAIGALVGGGW